MKRLVLCMAVCWGGAAIAGTCEPGYYPVDGTCTICPQFYACPDGDKIIGCSGENTTQYTIGTGATQCLDCPTTLLHPEGLQKRYTYRGETAGLWSCRVQWRRRTEHGEKFWSCSAVENGYYDDDTVKASHCMLDTAACDAGYVSVLPKNNYGDYRTWFDSYPVASDFEVCVPAGFGRYSADGEIEGTACPAGTSTRTPLASSVDECLALCTGGVTKFRVGAYSFNLWRDKYTTPALDVRMPNGTVCYVNLASGAATGTMNIRVGDKTYHVTN